MATLAGMTYKEAKCMELLVAFAFGLVTGSAMGVIPELIKHASFRKNLEKLSDDEYERIEEMEDPDEAREREQKEEDNIRFF